MDINKKTALKIRELRENKSYTQQYMADNLGVSKNSYSLIELGKTKIHLELLAKISELLETPLDKILSLPDNNVQNNENSFVVTQNNSGTLYFSFSEEMLLKIKKKL